MKVRIFGISDRSTLEPLSEPTLSAAWQQDSEHRWIDVEAATQQELRELLAPLDLHPLILDACLQSGRSSRFISQRTALYLEVPTHLSWDRAEKPYISVLCLKTTIITIHRDRQHTIEDIIQGLDAEVPLYANDASALLFYLLTGIGRCTVDEVLDVRAEAERLDQAYHERPELLDPKRISILRRKLSHCAAVHDDHTYCAGVLQTVESEAFRISEQPRQFHELLKLAELAGTLIEGTESRVASLQRDYEMSVQKMSRADCSS